MNRIGVWIAVATVAFMGAAAFIIITAVTGGGSTNDAASTADNFASETTNPTQQAAVTTNDITIRNYSFTPSKITVKKGTTVTWTNEDGVKHDIRPDSESEAFQGSELLDRGESYSFTFNEVGTFTYHCTPHSYMTGTVEVVE